MAARETAVVTPQRADGAAARCYTMNDTVARMIRAHERAVLAQVEAPVADVRMNVRARRGPAA